MDSFDRLIEWLAGNGRWIGGFDAMQHEVEPIAGRLIFGFAAFFLFLALGWDLIYWEWKTVSRSGAATIRHMRRCYFLAAISIYLFSVVQLWWPCWRAWYFFTGWMLLEGCMYLRGRLGGVLILAQDREQRTAYLEQVRQASRIHEEVKHIATVVTEIQAKASDQAQQASSVAAPIEHAPLSAYFKGPAD